MIFIHYPKTPIANSPHRGSHFFIYVILDPARKMFLGKSPFVGIMKKFSVWHFCTIYLRLRHDALRGTGGRNVVSS